MLPTKPTQIRMRIACTLLISLVAFGLSACATPPHSPTPVEGLLALTDSPQQTFRFGVPVDSQAHALIAAQAGLRTSFTYLEPLTVVQVEPMTYGEYSHRLGESANRPSDPKVWLVVYFDDKWQSLPSVPNAPHLPPFRGCVYVSVNADDGSPLDIGGPFPSGRLAECDQ